MIAEPSQVAEARRAAANSARRLGFDEAFAAKAAIVTAEAATNLLKHAREGEIVLSQDRSGDLLVMALDKGPGISNLAESLRDGYSTAGSPGTGLGAITRLSAQFDVYSRTGAGTAIVARVAGRSATPAAPPIEIGGLAVARPGEGVCGDAFACACEGPRTRILLVDGLGHGFDAARAAETAVTVFWNRSGAGPAELIEELHAALRPTRGAVAAVAEIDIDARNTRYCGIGNISATIVGPERQYNMVSHNGTLGHDFRKAHEFSYAWPQGAVLIMHSDGLSRRWNLADYPGLAARSAALIAGVLYRDWKRDRDDVTVVVAREGRRL